MEQKKRTIAKNYKIRITYNAFCNIDEITGYLAFINQQPANAIRVGDAIFETINRIQQHPYAFKECEELQTKSKMYRQAICLSWLIVYKIEKNTIIILGVLHCSRKPSTKYSLKRIK